MPMKKATCPNCNLPLNEGDEKCPFCGADLSANSFVEETQNHHHEKEAVKKHSIPLYEILFLVSAGLTILVFFLMFLPATSGKNADGVGSSTIYAWCFNNTSLATKTGIKNGTNCGTIIFIMTIISAACHIAVQRSVQKKTAEISLFAVLAAALSIVGAIYGIVGFASMPAGTTYKSGFGFILIGFVFLLSAAAAIAGIIFHKIDLRKNPSKNYSVE